MFEAVVSTGAAGRSVAYRWHVKWAASVNTSSLSGADITRIDNLNSTLTALGPATKKVKFNSSMVDFSHVYVIVVEVENFLGQSDVEEKEFEKIVDQIPSVRLPGGYKFVLASQKIKIEGMENLEPLFIS